MPTTSARLWQPSHYNGVLQQKLYDTQARDIYYLAFTGGLLTFVIRGGVGAACASS